LAEARLIDDEEKDPVEYLIGCAHEYGDEYLISRPDLRRRIAEGATTIREALADQLLRRKQ
jgi:hypothetical protein